MNNVKELLNKVQSKNFLIENLFAALVLACPFSLFLSLNISKDIIFL